MNEDEMKGKLKQAKGRIQFKWGELTDDEIKRMEGDREELIGKVQERLRLFPRASGARGRRVRP